MATTQYRADLTPFGFTPTETSVYFALLGRGPSSGYAVARELSIARANAYQALRGLVAKGAAHLLSESPQKFRAIRPEALYAQIVDTQARRLDKLEADLAKAPEPGAEPVVRVTGKRAVLELMARTLARENGPIRLLAPLPVLSALVPVLRKRAADAAETTVWVVGAGGQLPVPIVDAIPVARVREFFPIDVALLITDTGAMVARQDDDTAELQALWSGDLGFVGVVRAGLDALTAGAAS